MSRNSAGTPSVFSAEASTYTLAAVPGVSFAGVYSTVIALTISANNNPSGTGFVLQSSTDSNFIAVSSASLIAGTTQLNNFTMYTTYYFRVRAEPANNPPTAWSAVISSVTTGIDSVAVTGPQYANANGITWAWTQASGNGADLLNYRVQVFETDSATPLTDTSAGTNINYSFTQVTDKKQYYCRVQVIKTGGVSAWSSSGNTSVDTGAPDPVSQIKPANSQTFSDNVTFTWPAATDSESPIASYWLQVVTPQSGTTLNAPSVRRDISTDTVAVFDGEVGNVLAKEITGLESGKVYYARVKAKDSAGNWGNFSNYSIGVTVWSATTASAQLLEGAIVAPNPVNPDDPIMERRMASVLFYMPETRTVSIKIYTLTGRPVLDLSQDVIPVGNCGTWLWDCKNGDGVRVAPGGYICVLNGHREKSERIKIAVWY
jgi:hypothetical protein